MASLNILKNIPIYKALYREKLYGLGDAVDGCWRSILRTVWNQDKYTQDVQPTGRMEVCTTCCQQFVLSRAMVHARPREVWKKLHYMIGM